MNISNPSSPLIVIEWDVFEIVNIIPFIGDIKIFFLGSIANPSPISFIENIGSGTSSNLKSFPVTGIIIELSIFNPFSIFSIFFFFLTFTSFPSIISFICSLSMSDLGPNIA